MYFISSIRPVLACLIATGFLTGCIIYPDPATSNPSSAQNSPEAPAASPTPKTVATPAPTSSPSTTQPNPEQPAPKPENTPDPVPAQSPDPKSEPKPDQKPESKPSPTPTPTPTRPPTEDATSEHSTPAPTPTPSPTPPPKPPTEPPPAPKIAKLSLNTSQILINTNPTGQIVLSSEGTLPVNYEFDQAPAWVSLTSTAGRLEPGESRQITITPDRSNLKPGTSDASLVVRSNGGDYSFRIYVKKIDTSVLAFGPEKLTLSSSMDQATAEVFNTGPEYLNLGVTSTQPWLKTDSKQILIGPKGSFKIAFRVDRSVISGGIFEAALKFDWAGSATRVLPITVDNRDLSSSVRWPDDAPEVYAGESAKANSSKWLVDHHDQISQIRPRYLVINFANRLIHTGHDIGGQELALDEPAKIAQRYFAAIRKASLTEERLGNTHSFIDPQLHSVVDLRDDSPHANSALFPRSPVSGNQCGPDKKGFKIIGYRDLFGEKYRNYFGGKTLQELVDSGEVHEVLMIANQVNGRPELCGTDGADQVTSNILEVAGQIPAYSYDPALNRFDRQAQWHARNGANWELASRAGSKDFDPVYDHNNLPYFGRSVRVIFQNVSRDPGATLHGLLHYFEFFLNEAQVSAPGNALHGKNWNSYWQPYFRQYANFDFNRRYGLPFNSLYEMDNSCKYTKSQDQVNLSCKKVFDDFREPLVCAKNNVEVGCGNAHYTPASVAGYQYDAKTEVMSYCRNFRKDPLGGLGAAQSWNYDTELKYLEESKENKQVDPQQKFMSYWYQNLPGYRNGSFDSQGRPMKNWWVFFYY